MTAASQRHRRRSIRLKGYVYSQAGAYFITVCSQDRVCLFGEVTGDQMRLNDAGRMVLSEWNRLTVRFPAIELDAFVVMPNHIHGIIAISNPNHNDNANVGAGLVPAPGPPMDPPMGTTTDATTGTVLAVRGATTRVAPTRDATLGDIVGAFKSLTTDLYIQGVRESGWPAFRGRLWQRNYFEHIVRDEEELTQIRQYILDNPARWAYDRENPQAEEPRRERA